MFTKLLLTALVIFGALMVLRTRRQRYVRPEAPIVASAPSVPKTRIPQVVAYGLIVMVLAGAGYFLYLDWRDNYRVVTLRVIDSRTGKETRYQARKGDVEGRQFRTVDGKEVSLAEVERLELGGE